MSSLFARLNLQPQERRLVVAVGLVVFGVLNYLFIWPRFGDWKKLKKQQITLEDNITRYQRLIDKVTTLKKDLNRLESQGEKVATEAQALVLQDNVYSQASLSGVQVSSYTPMRSSATRTNQFFEEQSGTISFTSGEQELVDFLYSLSSGNSLIRVLSMTLQPDRDHLKLGGTITFAASYQRSGSPKTTAAPATPTRTNAPAAKASSPLTGAGKTNTAATAAGKTNKPAARSSSKPTVTSAKPTNAPAKKP